MSSDTSSGHAIEAHGLSRENPPAVTQVRRSHLITSFDGSGDAADEELEDIGEDEQSFEDAHATRNPADVGMTDPSAQLTEPEAGASSVDLANLVAALPTSGKDWQTVPSKKKQKEKKKPIDLTSDAFSPEARANALAFMENRKRAREEANSGIEQMRVAKRASVAPQESPVAGDQMDIETADTPLDYKQVMNPSYIMCALKVGNRNVIGDQFNHRKGYQIRVHWNAGRYGVGSIQITFKINKHNLNEDLSPKDSEVYFFGWEYKFNVAAEYHGQLVRSIQDYSHEYIDAANPGVDNKVAVSGCPDDKKGKLTTMRFTPYSTFAHVQGKPPSYNVIAALGDKELTRTISSLASLPQVVQVWFCNTHHAVTEETSLKYLRNIYEKNLPPLFQYYSEGQLQSWDIMKAPTINEVGNGMYAGKVKGKDGQTVEEQQAEDLKFASYGDVDRAMRIRNNPKPATRWEGQGSQSQPQNKGQGGSRGGGRGGGRGRGRGGQIAAR